MANGPEVVGQKEQVAVVRGSFFFAFEVEIVAGRDQHDVLRLLVPDLRQIVYDDTEVVHRRRNDLLEFFEPLFRLVSRDDELRLVSLHPKAVLAC